MRRPVLASIPFLANAALASPLLSESGTPGHRLTKCSENNSTSTLQWTNCAGLNATTVPVDCSSIEVPLDYTDKVSGRKLKLELVRAPAPKQPSKGSVLVNFGGPGGEGQKTLLIYAASATGGEFDLISFDPRGTGTTMPFTCFDDPHQLQLMLARYQLDPPDASDISLGTTWAQAGAWANACADSPAAKSTAELVGTAFVARDMMQIVDALGGDRMLRYWGISYGTTLGATVAAMFPDRVERVLLDGVVNSHRYYHNSGVDIDQLGMADEAWTGFLEECTLAGPEKCAIAALAPGDATTLATVLQDARESYRHSPIAVGSTVLTYTAVSTLYYIFTRTLDVLAESTQILLSIARRDEAGLKAVVEFIDGLGATVTDVTQPLYAIKCGDQFPRYNSLEGGVLADIEHYIESSSNFGNIPTPLSAMCARWPYQAKERYAGDFQVKTRHPVLFLHNTFDAATGRESAYNMSSGFEGSRVVEQVGYGHGTFAQSSECTMKLTREYFLTGKVPEENTKCTVDTKLFP
ncbi:TAP-like protein-domain-containing protein [Microdochium bolleyi]|uniref:TAP-like protein-domain-containing protein n=1 Tax=Microdochium bolleyi TaxID=196109 RepID=A0A136IMG1_9PEZI|nr:TAP-like protein-domain-containing protein [Microdochium bolleyi]